MLVCLYALRGFTRPSYISRGGGEGGGGGPHRYTDTPCHPPCPDRRIGVSAYLPPGSAYRRIGVFAPGSAYRRIGVFPARIGVSAYRRISCPYRRIGVCAPSGPCIGVSAYRRKAVLRHYLQARWLVSELLVVRRMNETHSGTEAQDLG